MRLIQVKLTINALFLFNFSLIPVEFPRPDSQGALISCVDKSHMALERTGSKEGKICWKYLKSILLPKAMSVQT